ncbi:hypothetical protein GDO81_025505 [Engystomops pustulosus]|uniref:Frog antimicrobial peptide propeptide domain-containing protein n=1 Tax=Engystomops pustulosus TaxID=76066 RepID=A0AAV6YMI0_ENGPU|nr:hypothetical protein GDO81_025505 [Engystomops pustulosus]
MVFLKKSLFLVLCLGFVSLSICREDKRQDDEEHEEEREIEGAHDREKRFFKSAIELCWFIKSPEDCEHLLPKKQ